LQEANEHNEGTRQTQRETQAWEQQRSKPRNDAMERKIFWIIVTVLGLVADIILPIWWALFSTIPIIVLAWWVAYRSDWF
jgi:hypothetical protein